MGPWGILLAAIVGLAAGLGGAYWWFAVRPSEQQPDETEDPAGILNEAKAEAKRILAAAEIEAKEKVQKIRSKVSEELDTMRKELAEQRKDLARWEERLKKQQSSARQREADLDKQTKALKQKEQTAEAAALSADRALSQARQQLEELAGLSAEQALERLNAQLLDEAKAEAAATIKKIEDEARAEADARTKTLIATAIQRYAGEYVAERTVSVVELPSDEMKGRIIGREGRNIRTFEAATGVDVVIDDTPEAVLLSCFNPVRREVARLALTRLVADGRIHPARIEDVVGHCESEIQAQCKEAGEQVVFDLGIHKMDSELIRLIGTLKYRSSYAQNLLRHSAEVGFLAGLMASELGISVKQARRAGLLHDIGKALDQNVEGDHAQVGAELARKHGESPAVVQAIATHHGNPEPATLLDIVVQTANNLSARRPGARRDMLESFVRRIDVLEKLCKGFDGVKKAYAIQAGREVRVVVANDRISDERSVLLAREIAEKIENELSYPGQIRVHVLRESRYTDVAK
ncbi:MAG: ribonuclease Y [Deltaproteobacteria bacterium]|nr:ribonuclease Y [Deltaproteobacteria bacterium]